MATMNAAERGESLPGEFSWGPGLMPNRDAGGGNVPGPGLSSYDQLRATRMTDPANPEASEDDVFSRGVSVSSADSEGRHVAGTLRESVTPAVRTNPGMPSTGQHGRIVSGEFNYGHQSDGLQDGSGAAWRASVPSNPVL